MHPESFFHSRKFVKNDAKKKHSGMFVTTNYETYALSDFNLVCGSAVLVPGWRVPLCLPRAASRTTLHPTPPARMHPRLSAALLQTLIGALVSGIWRLVELYTGIYNGNKEALEALQTQRSAMGKEDVTRCPLPVALPPCAISPAPIPPAADS